MKILIIFTLLFSLKGFSQDPRLFENTWYLHDLVINGVSNIPPINNEIPYVPAIFYQNGDFFSGMCENSGQGDLEYISTTEFNVLEMNFLQGQCYQNYPQNQDYSDLYQGFWGPLSGGPPVSYNIIVNGQIRILNIISPNGNYAVYGNEIPLSLDIFTSSNFLIYPNPVKDILQIDQFTDQVLKAIIYDMMGKKLLDITIGKSISTIDVKAFTSGLYFVVFESETGERVSKKFVKK